MTSMVRKLSLSSHCSITRSRGTIKLGNSHGSLNWIQDTDCQKSCPKSDRKLKAEHFPVLRVQLSSVFSLFLLLPFLRNNCEWVMKHLNQMEGETLGLNGTNPKQILGAKENAGSDGNSGLFSMQLNEADLKGQHVGVKPHGMRTWGCWSISQHSTENNAPGQRKLGVGWLRIHTKNGFF